MSKFMINKFRVNKYSNQRFKKEITPITSKPKTN